MGPRAPIPLVGLACCVAAAISLRAQAPAGSPDGTWSVPPTAAIRTLLAERVAQNRVGAVVVGVIEPAGRRVIAYGRSGAADGRPLDGDSLFQIGSVTKVFTGLLLADMVERGEVELDDPASSYLPAGATMPRRGRPITLLDLAKHRSALPSMPLNFTLTAEPNPYEGYTAEQIYQFLSSYELPREPGIEEYSNLGVALLGRLLGHRAGMDYEDLLGQRVLRPLKLRSTAVTLTSEQQRRTVPGHDRFLHPVDTWYLKAMPASGSLWSSANDLLNLLSFNLGLQDSPLRSAMLLQRSVPGRTIGWAASRLGGELVYGHTGGKEGYRSAIIFNPRTRRGVVILVNARTGDSPWALAQHLLFSGSPLPPPRPAPTRPPFGTLGQDALNAYVGEYQLDSKRTLRIARKRDHLLVDTQGAGVLTFFPIGERSFVANTEDQTLTFETDREGHTSGLVLHSGGDAVKAVRIPGNKP